MGSITVAAVAARALLVGLLAYAFVTGGLKRTTIAMCILSGIGIYFALSRIPNGAGFVTSALAVIDIALVFAIFRVMSTSRSRRDSRKLGGGFNGHRNQRPNETTRLCPYSVA